MTEEWRTIPSYPEYEASSHGRIRRPVPRFNFPHLGPNYVLAPIRGKDGYLVVGLRRRQRYIHRLVCEAFHGPSNGREAAHLDGTRTRNIPSNLAWVTKAENEAHKFIHGTVQRGSAQAQAKLTEEQVSQIRVLISCGESHREIALKFGVSRGGIWKIANGKKWRHVA